MPYWALVVLLRLIGSMRRMAGRLAPRAAFAPLAFLIARWPMLVAWGECCCCSFRGGREAHDSLSDLLFMGGLSAFSGLGVAPLGVGLPFLLVRAPTSPPAFAS